MRIGLNAGHTLNGPREAEQSGSAMKALRHAASYRQSHRCFRRQGSKVVVLY